MPKTIAFFGPIASGKTTRAKLLSGFLGLPYFSEIADSPFLSDMLLFRKNSLLNQLHFLYRDKNQILDCLNRSSHHDLIIYDYYIAQVDIFSRCFLNTNEYRIFCSHYEKVEAQIPKPSLIINLSIDLETNLHRIQSRNLRHESKIRGKDISIMHRHFANGLTAFKKKSRILELDATQDVLKSYTSRFKFLEIVLSQIEK